MEASVEERLARRMFVGNIAVDATETDVLQILKSVGHVRDFVLSKVFACPSNSGCPALPSQKINEPQACDPLRLIQRFGSGITDHIFLFSGTRQVAMTIQNYTVSRSLLTQQQPELHC